jgi:hypothetical protein
VTGRAWFWVILAAGVALSVGLSILIDGLWLFLLLPFFFFGIPIQWRPHQRRRPDGATDAAGPACPACGYRADRVDGLEGGDRADRIGIRFCPYDGSRLQ